MWARLMTGAGDNRSDAGEAGEQPTIGVLIDRGGELGVEIPQLPVQQLQLVDQASAHRHKPGNDGWCGRHELVWCRSASLQYENPPRFDVGAAGGLTEALSPQPPKVFFHSRHLGLPHDSYDPRDIG